MNAQPKLVRVNLGAWFFCAWLPSLLAQVALLDLTKPPVSDTNTILLLRFDELQHAVAKDSSARSHHGRVVGAKLAQGIFGQALEFDGDDDYVDCRGERGQPPDFDFDETTDFTVELWIKATVPKSPSHYSHLINKRCRPDAAEPGWMIYLRGGAVSALIADGAWRIELKHDEGNHP